MKRVDVVAKSNLSLPAKWLAVFMAHHENRNGEVITTPQAIRAWTALDRTTLWDAIMLLEGAGFIRVITPFRPGPKSVGRFAITWTEAAEMVDVDNQLPDEIVDDINQLVSGGAEKALEPRVGAQVVMSLSSPDVLSSPVLENKELRQESVTEVHATTTLNGNCPEWASELVSLPAFNRRGLSPKDIADTERDFRWVALAIEARSFVAWYSDGKKQLQRPMAAWRGWLRRSQGYAERDRNGKSKNGASPIEAGRAGGFADSSRYET